MRFAPGASTGTIHLESPLGGPERRLSAAADGTVAWQSFDGQDTEIWAARTDGSGLRQLTNDNREDRDPAVSTAGVAWWSTDGATSRVLGAAGGGGPIRTPTPSNVVVVDPRADVPGTLVYAKAGNVWLQRGDRAQQLTDGGLDAMPAISPDGEWVYFVRTTPERGRWKVNGLVRRFQLATPSLMRVRASGAGEPVALLAGRLAAGTYTWSYFIRQPSISPDGRRPLAGAWPPGPSLPSAASPTRRAPR